MKENKQTEKHQHISRIDQESKRTHGWYVRVRFKGENHSKFFSDLLHGGRDRSLLTAIAWRDSKEKEIGKPRASGKIFSVSRTNTGVVGVRFNEKLTRYEVSWVTPEGKQGKTSVSIKKIGRENAFVTACAIRDEKEAKRLRAKGKK